MPQPYHTRTYVNGMSYMFGPHTEYNEGEHPWIYYKGDQRVVIPPKAKSDAPPPPAPPAWLVADWMIAKSKGIPLSERADAYCTQPTKNEGLLWLREYLRQ